MKRFSKPKVAPAWRLGSITQYKGNEDLKDLLEKAKTLKEDFTKIEEALYQTKNRSGQDPLNFPIRLTNKLGHLNALVGMGDFAPTDQDIAVKNELTCCLFIEEAKIDIDEKIEHNNKRPMYEPIILPKSRFPISSPKK